ncbi:hypothetical protein GLOIN_2v1874831 [Rhizophagus irregularis DAOM 181602=DAOM 197198]|uniref:Uncharacterized protein n=1 Tax=Rhizophagus irregularis (strain DAOM 181602 / DAOM 197198 / MUCL 43194) TaxID=747089 RepID=A0A2P4Q5C9_RHIID|nr:hypothetical protein GLOIN_2v1874831 [Rhizophagus irregularis DAOM 181602=DAOM 197198]POG72853.1 hypothetical protein GLOIN_2v1874831 [Rhizophagus irregularis DAOM 181602=DAOM 197198]GBC15887.2 hypothetical protein GLOIN_2v1874831 [Rhizophagus irregularis DAOM 181602=DAOM 197198]CAG8732040.1 4764_t:CDS:2 [Rhizophagus irregularis]|eukprot:XP_025179719.1 hypothetical protein GLOIN_2v1874831 [Rhizophagus irregularis DAOM 181602=DAOM 197198]
MSDDETDEDYNEFIKEYGLRYEWDNEGNPEFIPEWQDWKDLFCEIKIYWKTKAVRHWGEKIFKRFVYSLPSVRNPTSLFHVLLQSDAIYLPQILSLIGLPYYPLELRSEIWPNESGFYHVHDLDKVVEMLIQTERGNAPDFITVPDFTTAFSDYLRQASNVQIST